MVNLQHVLSSLLFAGIGIVVLILSFIIIDKLTPHNLWKEIIENRNVSLAIVVASFMLGLAIIISSAIHE
jgi:putative membrane protein